MDNTKGQVLVVDDVRKVYLAALLHDVRMILVEDMLLNKQGALTLEEQRRIQERRNIGQTAIGLP